MTACPKRIVWGIKQPDGRLVKHELIEILGDKALVMAPPSYRVRDGITSSYNWLPNHSPHTVDQLAVLPDWLIKMPSVGCKSIRERAKQSPSKSVMEFNSKNHLGFREVFQAISTGERQRIVESWGLRLVGNQANQAGFIRCRAIGREDNNPSASYHRDESYYSEPGGECFQFFELGSILGVYKNAGQCCNHLGSIYLKNGVHS